MAKVEVQQYKKSINESGFSHEEITMIWEFYVTKSFAKTAEQHRVPADYGLKQIPYNKMLEVAEITKDMQKVLCANSIKETLKRMDLQTIEKENNIAIDIETCRIACLTPYSISDEEEPKPRIGSAECVLTHIRNSFAHGITYFFDNGNMLLEDKDNRGTITARILIHQKTLLEWIQLIDYNHKFYMFDDINADEQEEEKNNEGDTEPSVNGVDEVIDGVS